MIRKSLPIITVVASCLILGKSAYADGSVTISNLASSSETRSYFQKMLGKRHLPSWVTKGGTDSPSREVTIQSRKYLVLTSCKPHDCASESVAMLFSPQTREMTAVLSKSDASGENQTLAWFNVTDNLSIDGKTVLFAALSGSLENHPQSFNYR
ncbi:Ivy family C-type lysozyme inhibitor [Asaia prunellae]|uniref:Ivy family C-type lysozyme inhibitor n=1 Tax=Asaia prunellae TaxID=610245 RepID=UPI0011DDD6C2|nr:Ivy family C-type lysozyme inhibitor [Asaia prunellae]